MDLGYYIKATAKLVDENGNAITDANGNAITSGFSAKRFTSDMLKNGDTIHYTLPASVVKKYAGKKLISQVEIYFAFDTDTLQTEIHGIFGLTKKIRLMKSRQSRFLLLQIPMYQQTM